MKQAILIVCVAAIVVVMGLATGGIAEVVIFEESFEDGTVGSPPSGWTSQHNSNQSISAVTASDGDQSVRHDVSAFWAGSRYQSFDAPVTPYTLSFDLRYSSESSITIGKGSSIWNALYGSNYTIGAGIAVDYSNDIYLFVQHDVPVKVPALLDTWYQFRADVNPESRTIDYFYRVLGEETMTILASDLPFPNDSAHPGVMKFGGGGDEPSTIGYIDNIELTHEPVPLEAPVADADGPYIIDTGYPLILNASDSTDVDDDIVSYLWDLNDDGVFETDAGGNMFFVVRFDDVVSLGLSAGDIYDINLKVTDATGLFDTDYSQLKIIPEPATLTMLALGGLALIRRRRKR
jgi:hypothetical protein